MRIRPTPRRIPTGSRSLRTQRAVNYQELYDYHTGRVKPTRGRLKPKEETTPMPSTLSAARLAAHAASKNPNVRKGTTPRQTIPVLVLRPTKAEDSDDTLSMKMRTQYNQHLVNPMTPKAITKKMVLVLINLTH